MIWFTSEITVASSPSPKPNWAFPEAHDESLKPVPLQAVPWFEPSSKYFHVLPASIRSPPVGGALPLAVNSKSKLISELPAFAWCTSTDITFVPVIKPLVIDVDFVALFPITAEENVV